MDFVSEEIDRRFDQQSFILPIAIEDLLLKACAENSDDVMSVLLYLKLLLNRILEISISKSLNAN